MSHDFEHSQSEIVADLLKDDGREEEMEKDTSRDRRFASIQKRVDGIVGYEYVIPRHITSLGK